MNTVYVIVEVESGKLTDEYFTTDHSVAEAQCDELNNEVDPNYLENDNITFKVLELKAVE